MPGTTDSRQDRGAAVTAGATVAGVLLAAGAGRRLGRPKALVEVGGTRLVDHGVRVLAAGRRSGRGGDRRRAGHPAGVITAVNPDWPSGMGSSLADGPAGGAGRLHGGGGGPGGPAAGGPGSGPGG